MLIKLNISRHQEQNSKVVFRFEVESRLFISGDVKTLRLVQILIEVCSTKVKGMNKKKKLESACFSLKISK